MVAGCNVVIAGTGLFAAVMVKVTAFEVPPPGAGFVTVTVGVPAAATSLAGMAAVSLVALTKVVARGVPLKFTTDVVMKFEPFTVRVNAPEPAVAVAGCRVVIAGTGLLAAVTVKVTTLDVPPPGEGLVTVTAGVPTLAMSVASMAAVSLVALTKAVARAVPLKFTTDVLMKFEPFTVSVKAPEPAVAVAGCRVVIAGTGLLAAVTVKVTALDVPPPGDGLVTVTVGVPTLAMSEASMAAVSLVALTKVVARAVPLKFTTDVAMKF